MCHSDHWRYRCKSHRLRIFSDTPQDQWTGLARLLRTRSARRLCLSIYCLRGRTLARGISWIHSTIFHRILHGEQKHFWPMTAATAVLSPKTELPQSKLQHIKRNNGMHQKRTCEHQLYSQWEGSECDTMLRAVLSCPTLCCAVTCPKTTAMGSCHDHT